MFNHYDTVGVDKVGGGEILNVIKGRHLRNQWHDGIGYKIVRDDKWRIDCIKLILEYDDLPFEEKLDIMNDGMRFIMSGEIKRCYLI